VTPNSGRDGMRPSRCKMQQVIAIDRNSNSSETAHSAVTTPTRIRAL
jgi:hypothetical protein